MDYGQFVFTDETIITRVEGGCDGSESDRYSYIAAYLSMGATEVNGDDETCVFPEGSEGAVMEMQLIENYYLSI